MERPWRKPGPLSFRYLRGRVGTNAPAADTAASQMGRRRRRDRARLGILRGLYSLSLSTARFLSHVTTIANPDCRGYRPYGTSFAHCGRSSQRAIKGAAVSIFVSPNRFGEVN